MYPFDLEKSNKVQCDNGILRVKDGTVAPIVPTAIVDSVATDVAGLVANYNALLAALRTAGIIA